MQPIIEIKEVFFKYPSQKEWQLKGIDLSVYAGENVGIIGANGTGKSTLLKVLIGIYKPQKGVIKLLGKKSKWTNHYPEAGYIGDPGYSTEELGLPNSLKVKEILEITVKLNNVNEYSVLRKGLDLGEIEEKFVYQLSTGQRKRLMAAITLIRNPSILILDEPLDGLDEHIRVFVENELLGFYADNSKTIVLISHNKSEIDSFSDKVFKFSEGTLISIQQSRFEVTIERKDKSETDRLKSGQILKRLTTEMEEAIKANESISFTLKPTEQ